MWGDGSAVRSYTYVDDMVDGVYRLMQSGLEGPVNIGNPEYVTVDELVRTVVDVSGKDVKIRHVKGPVGVQSRNFSNGRMSRSAGAPDGRCGADRSDLSLGCRSARKPRPCHCEVTWARIINTQP